jgi:hypothetical protein
MRASTGRLSWLFFDALPEAHAEATSMRTPGRTCVNALCNGYF